LSKRTVRKVANGEHIPVLSEEGERHVGRPLAYHEVDGDEALEDDCPCRVAHAVLERSEDLGDSGLARVRGHEDVLDVFCLGGSILLRRGFSWSALAMRAETAPPKGEGEGVE
jgi:hypothetical protein